MTPLQRSRVGATAFFAVNGIALFAVWPRLGQIQVDLGLDDAGLGIVLAVGTVGGLLVGPLAAPLVHRWNAISVASVAGLLSLPPLVFLGWAGTPIVFALALGLVLAADAVMDSAMNTRGGRSARSSVRRWDRCRFSSVSRSDPSY